MPLLSPKALAGPGYIILNVLRGMNIIALLAVICACLVMIVKTIMVSHFFFFDAVSHVITAGVSTFLIISEASLFRSYIARNWPLLSPLHGFVTLGLAMLVLGVNILGNLNKQATSQENLGLAFWRIVIGAGILVTILGFFNIIASFIFRDAHAGVTARQVRAKGAVAISTQQVHYQPSYSQNSKAGSFRTNTSNTTSSSNNSWPLKHNPSLTANTAANTGPPYPPSAVSKEKSSHNRFSRFKPRNLLPSYHEQPKQHAPPASSYYGDDDADRRRSMQISAPIGTNPQFAHLNLVPQFATRKERPDSTYHPARANQY